MKYFLLTTTFIALFASSARAESSFDTLTARLDQVINKAIEEKRIVGTVVIVSKDGQIVYRKAAGYADREAKIPMREDNQFRLASMTKTIVSAAALAMAQRGQIGLDEPITKWLPQFRPKLKDGTEPKITIRQLLTHTAGLNYGFMEADDGPYHKAKVSDGLDQPGLSIDENMKRLASAPLLFEPGTRWNYSLSIDVLGAVLEKATQGPLRKVILKNVAGPLGMTDSDFEVADRKRLAVPYVDAKPEPARMKAVELVPFAGGNVRFEPARAFNKRSYQSGGAGMVGTAGDYIKLLEAIRTTNGALLNPDSMKLLTENQLGSLQMDSSPGWTFTCGAAVLLNPAEAKTKQSAGTIKWGGIYGHTWFMDPKEKLSVVQMTNTTLEGTKGAFPEAITNAIYGDTK